MVVSLPYSVPQPMKSLPFYILQLSLKSKPLSGEISLKGHYSEHSGIPPYNHPVYATTSLLRPYSFNPNLKITESFYYCEDPINETTSTLVITTRILWTNRVRINGVPLYSCIPTPSSPQNCFSFLLGLFSLF